MLFESSQDLRHMFGGLTKAVMGLVEVPSTLSAETFAVFLGCDLELWWTKGAWCYWIILDWSICSCQNGCWGGVSSSSSMSMSIIRSATHWCQLEQSESVASHRAGVHLFDLLYV